MISIYEIIASLGTDDKQLQQGMNLRMHSSCLPAGCTRENQPRRVSGALAQHCSAPFPKVHLSAASARRSFRLAPKNLLRSWLNMDAVVAPES